MSPEKKDKYFRYIADDMISNTIFDQYDELGNTYTTKGYYDGNKDGLYILPPYSDFGDQMWLKRFGILKGDEYNTNNNIVSSHMRKFCEYVLIQYGSDGDECETLFSMYKSRLVDMIK